MVGLFFSRIFAYHLREVLYEAVKNLRMCVCVYVCVCVCLWSGVARGTNYTSHTCNLYT